MALKVLMFSDFICPFCYIGFETVRKLKAELGFELEWRGFQIHPDWPAEGIAADKVYRGMSEQTRTAIWTRITAMADAVGITMKPPTTLTNSHAALVAAEYVREECADKADDFTHRVFRAYFEQGLNIGDIAVLETIGAEAGIGSERIAEAVGSPKYALRLKNNVAIGSRRGVSGVPAFFIGEFPLIGAQSEDIMRSILTRAIERQDAIQ